MSEAKMRVQASELAAIVAATEGDGEQFTFDRIQTGYRNNTTHAVLIDREGEPVGVPLRRDVEPMLSLVRRLARDLADERAERGDLRRVEEERDRALDERNDVKRRLSLALTVELTFTDDVAAMRVTPAQATAYLRGKGWSLDPLNNGVVAWWRKSHECAGVPERLQQRDYGRRMAELVRTVASCEGRSPIAVWLDLLAEAP